ncbi:DUF3006 domain-containing protein [Halomarina oriensis]|uniref:DUF3006 family protein n=1 Tax=Halomarina oriensis TaxID=671145 RepID=A0A6B0GTM5_9EURY|nr:DUF3006 domain-containing protein [Halomarina oriensis]MWG36727.1 DUF3006 family protein [Halomarina oriensis]
MSTPPYALGLLLVLTLVTPLGHPLTTAVVDRFEGDDAVLVTDDGRQVTVERARLPERGRHVDAVFRVSLAHGTLTSAEYDASATRQRSRSVRRRFDRLATSRSGTQH